MTLLYVTNLVIRYRSAGHGPAAVEGASFLMQQGEVVGVVGGSGSGKSSMAMAIGRLTDYLPCSVEGGISLMGKPVLALNAKEIRDVRKHDIAYVFQEPAVALNPVFRVRDQIREALDKYDARSVQDLLKTVKLDDAARVANAYPHQLSGGMKQRVMIAMALAKNPSLLIADEPTTALDVTVQKEILRLFVSLKKERKLSVLFITHDLQVAAAVADRILVMHEGRIVEEINEVQKLQVAHPYSKKLLSCSMAGRKPKSFFEV